MTGVGHWGIALCGALIGAGLVLIFQPGGDPGPAPAGVQGTRASKPPRVGASAGLSKSYFSAQVRPIAKWEAAASIDIAAAFRRAKTLLRISSVQLRGRMLRELASGHAFESEVALSYERSEDRELATLTVPRGNGASQRYRVELRDGVITEVHAEREAADGVLHPVELPGSMSAILNQIEGGGLPISIGDLSVRDALALLHALRGSNWRVLGDVRMAGSRRLIVFEIDLEDESGATRGASSESLRSSGALAYVDAERWELHALRVFDGRDRLLRLYGDFAYRDSGEGPSLSGFRVSTLPSGSHTVFRLELLKLEN